MTNTFFHLEAALEDSLPFIYELWTSLGEAFKLNREDLLGEAFKLNREDLL